MSWLREHIAAAMAPAAPQPALGRDAVHRTFPPSIEAHARANGFHNAEQMLLWQQQREHPSGGTVSGGSRPSAQAAMAWHPANILAYVADAIGNVTGN